MAAAIAYICFDTVPAPKGAAIHIQAFTRALGAAFGAVDLVTVAAPNSGNSLPPTFAPGVQQTALPALGPTLIHRVLHFRGHLRQWLRGRRFEAIHIRSIYEGLPIALAKQRYCDRLIFEVNGLPSIELKYRYPQVVHDRVLRHKLLAQEQICLEAANLILTPSQVTREHLLGRGVPQDKIRVIPNGVDLQVFTYQPPPNPKDPFRLLYFGTLSAWQGVDLAVRALALAQSQAATELTILAHATRQQRQAIAALAHKLGVSATLHLLPTVSQAELVTYLHQSHALVAPFTLNDRNLVQGCCPLKVLEGMAAGTPVITSDLPVVRELGQPDRHFLAVKPGSVQAIVTGIERLRRDPNLAIALSAAARQQIVAHHTWEQAGAALVEAYEGLGIKRVITA